MTRRPLIPAAPLTAPLTTLLTTLLSVLLLLASTSASDVAAQDTARADTARPEVVLERIGFGSCAKQNQPQPIWESVINTDPDLFLLLGDNIYGDTRDMKVLRAKYDQFLEQPGFKALRKETMVLATWDDHDYGVNDGGAEYPQRQASQQIFLETFDVGVDDPRRDRQGVYSAHLFGPPEKRVQILLLDTRYFRSPLAPTDDKAEPGEGFRGPYGPTDDADATILGQQQWRWLEQQLRVPAQLRVIGSSIQVLSAQHGWEKWENFPHERRRLLDLVKKTGAGGVVFLSGDRHLAEISVMPVTDPLSPGYPILDITSSSLNAPSGNFTGADVRFANELNRYRSGLTFFDINFGMLAIDWSDPPTLRAQVRDGSGAVVLQHRLPLSKLQPTTD